MKKVVIFSLLCFLSFTTFAQINKKRKELPGKVNVSKDGDAGEINVFNLSSGEYTFTDDYGRFEISVKEGDEVVFSGIFYQQFSVIVTESVLKKGNIDVNIRTRPNRLDEVVVKPSLSGDIDVDVRTLKEYKRHSLGIDPNEILHGFDYEFEPDQFTSAGNDAIDKYYLQNGLNFVNIFKALFRSKDKTEPHKNTQKEDIDVEVRKVHNNEFFQKYLGIKEENINDFIFYLEENGLNHAMIANSNDLELIDFVIDRSKEYKAKNGNE